MMDPALMFILLLIFIVVVVPSCVLRRIQRKTKAVLAEIDKHQLNKLTELRKHFSADGGYLLVYVGTSDKPGLSSGDNPITIASLNYVDDLNHVVKKNGSVTWPNFVITDMEYSPTIYFDDVPDLVNLKNTYMYFNVLVVLDRKEYRAFQQWRDQTKDVIDILRHFLDSHSANLTINDSGFIWDRDFGFTAHITQAESNSYWRIFNMDIDAATQKYYDQCKYSYMRYRWLEILDSYSGSTTVPLDAVVYLVRDVISVLQSNTRIDLLAVSQSFTSYVVFAILTDADRVTLAPINNGNNVLPDTVPNVVIGDPDKVLLQKVHSKQLITHSELLSSINKIIEDSQ